MARDGRQQGRVLVKRSRGYWSAELDIGGDLDRFYQEYVLPLREMARVGSVGPLQEVQVLSGTEVRTTSVRVWREVDLPDSKQSKQRRLR